jgi:hypothetical protein
LLATINATLYAGFADHLRETVQNPRTRRWLNRCGGSALILVQAFLQPRFNGLRNWFAKMEWTAKKSAG